MTGHPSKKRVSVTVTHVGRITVHMADSAGDKYLFMRGDPNFPKKAKTGQSLHLIWHLKRWHVDESISS